MATRLYGIAATAAPISPAATGWVSTTGMLRRSLSTAKAAATESVSLQAITSGANNNACAFQLVSDPLDVAQTISGTFTGIIRGLEGATTDNVDRRWRRVYVVQSDGTTVRGTLLALGTGGGTTEIATTATGYQVANATAVTSVAAQAGDRIVVEVGFGLSATGTTPQATTTIGGNGTDHTNADPSSTGTVPWFEFSQNITFAIAPSVVSNTTVTGAASSLAQWSYTLPGGIANGDVLFATCYKENTAAVTLPADGTWTEWIPPDSGRLVTTSNVHEVRYYYKRCSGGESGTAVWTWTGATWIDGSMMLIRDAGTSGNPIIQGSGVISNTAVGTLNRSLTGLQPTSLLVSTMSLFTGGEAFTPPTNFTESYDGDTLGTAWRQQYAGGSSGTITHTGSPTSSGTMGLIEIAAPSGPANVDLSPLTFNLDLGSVSAQPSVALSPLTFSEALGAVQPAVPPASVALSPLAFSLAQGSIVPTPIVGLSPLTFALALGTVSARPSVAIAPLTFSLALGAVSGRPSVALSPLTFPLALGAVSPAVPLPNVDLAPITFTLTPGSVVPTPSVALSPLTFLTALGSVNARPSVALSPVSFLVSLGAVSGRPSVGLSPLTFAMGLGSVNARPSVGLSPISFALQFGSLSPAGVTPGAVSLSPITFNLDLGSVFGRPSVGLNPIAFALAFGSVEARPTISLNPLTFVLGLGSVIGRPSVTLNPVTFTLGLGTFSPAGQAVVSITPLTFDLGLGLLSPSSAAIERANVQLAPIAFLVKVRSLRPRVIPIEYEFVVLLDHAPERVFVESPPSVGPALLLTLGSHAREADLEPQRVLVDRGDETVRLETP